MDQDQHDTATSSGQASCGLSGAALRGCLCCGVSGQPLGLLPGIASGKQVSDLGSEAVLGEDVIFPPRARCPLSCWPIPRRGMSVTGLVNRALELSSVPGRPARVRAAMPSPNK